jgi:NAD(P)-dependent dehydrogenase (short-subunit alcohol dehydrogenase family)
MVTRAAEAFGGLDILVNNAGMGTFKPVADMSPEEWNRLIATNLTGVFLCTHAAIPALKKRGGGWILNISSLAGKNSFVGGAAYCASKAGLNAFSEALMLEVREDDIRVAYIMPGSVQTAYLYPGIGLATVASRSTRLRDDAVLAAAEALAGAVTPADLEAGRIYPPLPALRAVALDVATAAARRQYETGCATELPKPSDLRAALAARMYDPAYKRYR